MKAYLDNAATTQMDVRVLEKMKPYLTDYFGNPSSVHSYGRKARVAVEESREIIAHFLGAKPGEIYFASSGTEANNFLIFGILRTEFKDTHKRKLLYSAAEHHSVIDTADYIAAEGFKPAKLNTLSDATIPAEFIAKELDDDVSLVSVIHTNNETGAVNDIEKIAELKKEKEFYLHTDAVQAFGKIRIDVNKMGIDALTFSGHKIYGPKGIAGAYAKSGTPLSPLIFGGAQERNRRGGTENVAAIVGLAEAIKLAYEEMEDSFSSVKKLFEQFVNGFNSLGLEGVSLNLSKNQSPFVISLTFNPQLYNNDSEAMLMYLDINGIAASNGAACASGTLKPSHVIQAMGKTIDEANGTIRFSFGKYNRTEEIDYALDTLKNLAEKFKK